MDTVSSAALASRTSNMDDRFPAYIADGRWQPTRTGDYEADCRHGHELAKDIADRVSRDSNPLHLSVAMRAIVESGRWEGVEIGLFSRLGMMLS